MAWDSILLLLLNVVGWFVVPFLFGRWAVRNVGRLREPRQVRVAVCVLLALFLAYAAAFGVAAYQWEMPRRVLLLAFAASPLLVPFAGIYLARVLRMPDHGWKIGVILCTLAAGAVAIYFGWPPKLGIDLSGGVILVYQVDQAKKTEDRPVEMDKLVAAVSLRVNPGGVKEVIVRPYGVEQIEIKIPEVFGEEAKRIEKLISRLGSLEFRILANRWDHKSLIKRALAEENTDTLKAPDGSKLAWWVPVQVGQEGNFESYMYRGDPGGGRIEIPEADREVGIRERVRRREKILELLVVKDPFDVTGAYLTRATPGVDSKLQRCVNFSFNPAGGQLFGRLTGLNRPDEVQDFTRKLGIILDEYLYSAPAIQSTIFQRGEITGSFTKEEVEDLVNVLNAGSLPTALTEEPISRLETGPTLGQDTIDRGRLAIGVSMALVLLFMLVYYRFAGVVACGAMLANLVLILAIMITVGAAFTLPGLAGLVLIVGMAVDANVLIFERIREELGRGAALRMAIRNGFSRATTAIVDANVTTLITGVVLYWIGTDQVKGFAVTLILGVVLSMYTALFCSRVVFDVAEKRRWITKLKMMRIVGGTKIDFLGMRHVFGGFSTAVILIGLVCVGLRGKGILDIDFTGGVSVEILFKDPQNIADVREALGGLDDLVVSDVKLSDEPRGKRFRVDTSQKPEMDKKNPNKIKKTAVLVVEDHIHDFFGDELAANRMDFEHGPVGQKRAEKTAREKPAEPGDVDQARNGLPADSVLGAAGLAQILLAQAEPSEAEPLTGDAAAEEPSPEASPASPEKTGKTPVEAEDETTKATPEKPPGEPAAVPFAGGTQARLTFAQSVSYDTLMEMFAAEFGSENAVPFLEFSSPNPDYEEGDGKAYSTWDLKIKLPPEEAKSRLDSIQATVEDTPFFPSSNTIGGKVASSTRTLAIIALLASLFCIVVYIWIRFQRVVFGVAAVVALVHDVLVTLGVIALSAYLVQIPGFQSFLLIDPFKIGLPALAAFLTIIGYSLNDTIVVFDRIREVRGKSPRLTHEMVNTSINQTLARTLLTSLTTLIVVLILYIRGGQGIHGFAFALVIGVMVGTYSSIFVASPTLLWMSRPSGAK